MLNFKIKQIQFALFPKNFNFSDKIKITEGLQLKTKGIFDGEPTILPLPVDAPVEIPRVILQSKDGRYQCKIASGRIDIYFNIDDLALSEVLDLVKPIIKNLSDYFINELNTEIGRIGFVTSFVGEQSGVANFIKEKLLVNTYLTNDQNLRGVSVTTNNLIKNIGDSGYDLIKIIKIDSVRKKDGKEAILLNYDLNTLGEKFNEYNLSCDSIEKMIDNFSKYLLPDVINNLFEKNE